MANHTALYATTTDDLHQLLKLGLSVEQIAHRMGRSVDAVELMLQPEQKRTTT